MKRYKYNKKSVSKRRRYSYKKYTGTKPTDDTEEEVFRPISPVHFEPIEDDTEPQLLTTEQQVELNNELERALQQLQNNIRQLRLRQNPMMQALEQALLELQKCDK